MRILIIEPSNTYAQLISKLLENTDITVDICQTAKDSIEYLTTMTPDAICVAHELGDSNSNQFLLDINEISSCTNIPKFLITSNTSADFKRHCYDIGYTDIFFKDNIHSLQLALNSIIVHTQFNIDARILYIEDVPSTAAYTIAIMQQVNWEIDHVHTGEDAIAKLEDNHYDLVITDLILPGKISGLGLISEITKSEKEHIRKLPILAISGWNDLLRQVYVLQHGASDFISKPFKENDFLARSLNLIQGKRNIEKMLAEQKILFDKAHTDKLTGLNNRHGFEDNANRIVNNSYANQLPVTLLLLDLDNFKSINDIHGHNMGDFVLAQIGILLKSYSRQNDLAVRYGGEELLLLLPGCNEKHGLIKAEIIRDDIEKLTPNELHITTSIGMATSTPNELQNIESLINHADKALYRAKQQGRNRVIQWTTDLV